MSQRITPCLWFDGKAQEAAQFYCGIFKNSKVGTISRYGDNMPLPKGTVLTVMFTLDGQEYMALNGPPMFKFTEAVSMVVNCKDQSEVDYYWDKLLAGGTPSQCGWLKDKYGLSWQIVPTVIDELMARDEPEKSGRMMQAMMTMIKLDVAALKQAYG